MTAESEIPMYDISPWLMKDADVHAEAAQLALEYNWPEQAKQLASGEVPEGFGKEVGTHVALFLLTSPFDHIRRTRAEVEDMRARNRCHGKRLARLRYLIARIRCPQPT
jgi:hypothetical protein